ncbi:hypothetical protein [Streptomyces apocyni]|uniref:hypothetical protein n=1 Tax=Streptomyces apocyni TaxID=2654677 RepID=UPI0012EAD189|nr:hypothetical protein [Streptomyces apocyni]
MPGHGSASPQPSRPSSALLVVLRVIFVTLALGSLGFLSWAAMLRLAIVTRTRRDWAAFWGTVVALVVSIVLLAMDPTDDLSTAQGTAGVLGLLLTAVAVTAYYLTMDIRHHQPPRPTHHGYPPPHAAPGPYAHPQPHTATTQLTPGAAGYGYPPRPHAPAQPQPHAPSQPQYGAPVPPRQQDTPAPAPAPAPAQNPTQAPTPAPFQPPRPAPARIDQVRAELDELSDLLRHQDRPEGDGR